MHYQYGVHVIAKPTEIPMLSPSSTWFLFLKNRTSCGPEIPRADRLNLISP